MIVLGMGRIVALGHRGNRALRDESWIRSFPILRASRQWRPVATGIRTAATLLTSWFRVKSVMAIEGDPRATTAT